jgi:cytochrome c oxidase assembly protein subunit 11
MPSRPRKTSHNRVALICLATVVLMTGAAFAAVPLYKAFCQATGFGGAIPRAAQAPGQASGQGSAKSVTVYFDTNVRGLPWSFRALQRRQEVKLGSANVAYFEVVNNSDQAVTGRAAYNVTPDSAGWHVRKLQCFCFNAETLKPHETQKWPVIYFIDPKFASDPNMQGYSDLTLSYTFVPDPQEAPKAKAAGA